MKPIIIAFVLCTLFTSCNKRGTNQPSSAFTTFDISHLIADGGFHSEGFADAGTTNAATGIAKEIRWGSFTAPASTFPCYKIFQLVKNHFDSATQGACDQEGWIPKNEEHPNKEHPTTPVHIAMRYNQSGRHGELHLWLFPSEDETKVAFSLHLLEEPLR